MFANWSAAKELGGKEAHLWEQELADGFEDFFVWNSILESQAFVDQTKVTPTFEKPKIVAQESEPTRFGEWE